jgi:hypothetical protein
MIPEVEPTGKTRELLNLINGAPLHALDPTGQSRSAEIEVDDPILDGTADAPDACLA